LALEEQLSLGDQMDGEISYDLIMEDNMNFAEGTYRLSGGPWQVFIFITSNPKHQAGVAAYRRTWDSGVDGLVVYCPVNTILSKDFIERVLSSECGASCWKEVRGPDSIKIR
jgi:hypothetical protein